MTNSESFSQPPLFSVIVTTFDRPRMLSEAIESVLAQSNQKWECIVVDDAGSEQINLASDSRIRLLRREHNGGSAAARNTGILAARGHYVTFLDDDDLYAPDRLSAVLPALEESAVVVCWRTGDFRRLNGRVADHVLDDLVPHVGQVTVLRELVPLFDESLRGAEDVEWWLRLAQLAPVTTVPKPCYIARSHPGPRHGNGLRDRIDGSYKLMELHRRYFSTHPRAHAFRLKRIGLMLLADNSPRSARISLARSFRLKPQLSTLWHLLRSFRATEDDGPVD